MNAVSGMPGHWEADTSEMSHDAGFPTMFTEMFREPGLSIMDDDAPSFSSCQARRSCTTLDGRGTDHLRDTLPDPRCSAGR